MKGCGALLAYMARQADNAQLARGPHARTWLLITFTDTGRRLAPTCTDCAVILQELVYMQQRCRVQSPPSASHPLLRQLSDRTDFGSLT